jgi:hypothetical protein
VFFIVKLKIKEIEEMVVPLPNGLLGVGELLPIAIRGESSLVTLSGQFVGC